MVLARFICLLATGVAFGALLVGRGLILPAFDQPSTLLDANLAKALAGPIHLRVMEVVLAANLVLASMAERWLGMRWGTTLALLGAAMAGLSRFVVLPRLYATWSRTDLVAGRPLDRLALAEQLQTHEALLSWTCALLLLALLVAASRASEATPHEASTASKGPHTTHGLMPGVEMPLAGSAGP